LAGVARTRRECARDTVSDVDPTSIRIDIDNRSDAPLDHWRDRLDRQRRKKKPRKEPPKQPDPAGKHRPDPGVDDYAAPVPH
jgi:hypothetical protein